MKKLFVLTTCLLAACSDAEVGDSELCQTYCSQMQDNCTGDNAQYVNMADCLDYCGEAQWPAGREGDVIGNTVSCRIYHGGAPAAAEPTEHCPHAGSTGFGVCGDPITYRNEAPDEYTRVDRAGMPAVSTMLISPAKQDDYNDADPADDDAKTFVSDMAAQLTAMHGAFDDDLTAAALTPCSMTTMVNGLPECFGQEVAPGVTVASLIVPDTLSIDPSAPAGFPNGRTLTDQVIDITLSMILLELGGVCGANTCSATTLLSPPLNPPANDQSFETEFPYLAAAQQP